MAASELPPAFAEEEVEAKAALDRSYTASPEASVDGAGSLGLDWEDWDRILQNTSSIGESPDCCWRLR